MVYGGNYGIAYDGSLCDVPYSVIEAMVKYIQTDILHNNSLGITPDNLDFMVFVGDAEGHDVYNQCKPQHLTLMEQFINILKDGFGSYDIPIFFDLGNHEGLPVDNFGGPGIDDWFNQPLSEWISTWIDTAYSSKYDIKSPSDIMSMYGYYTSLIRPKMRLISINTRYIANGNCYLTFTLSMDGSVH